MQGYERMGGMVDVFPPAKCMRDAAGFHKVALKILQELQTHDLQNVRKNVLPKILRLANPPRSCFKSTHQSPSKRAKSVGCPGLSLPLFFTTLQISTYYGNSETLALKHQEIRTFHFNCAWISVSCYLDFKSSSFIRTMIPIPFSSRACNGAVPSSGDTRHFQRFAECIEMGSLLQRPTWGNPRHCSGELRWMLFYGCLMIPVRYWKFNVYR